MRKLGSISCNATEGQYVKQITWFSTIGDDLCCMELAYLVKGELLSRADVKLKALMVASTSRKLTVEIIPKVCKRVDSKRCVCLVVLSHIEDGVDYS